VNTNSDPSFYIGEVAIRGQLILAPMDGFTDHPFRLLCRRMGSAASYSEFINGIDIINGHPYLENRLFFSEEERPFGYHILENDPPRMAILAPFLQRREPDFVDLNLGCSSKQVCSRGAGAALLKDEKKIAELIRIMVTTLKVPVTAKIRIGWNSESINYSIVARIIQDNGGKCITVHGRTREQGYTGNADWSAIREVKNDLNIPVIGNGDVYSSLTIRRMFTETHCDAIMIGRHALENPWIFANFDIHKVPFSVKKDIILEHLDSMLTFYGQPRGIILFRKNLVHYLRIYAIPRETRINLLQSESFTEIQSIIQSLSL
jgi:tRNA-dihydrouridine synthase B